MEPSEGNQSHTPGAMTPSLIETVSSALRLRQKLWFCPARGTKGLKQSGKRLAGRLNPASCPVPSRDGSEAGLAYKPAFCPF